MFSRGTVKDQTLIQPRTPNTPDTSPTTTMRGASAAPAGRPWMATAPNRVGSSGLVLLLLDQLGYALAGLCPLGYPVVDPASVQAQPLLTTRCDGVEEADPLDEATTARLALIRHDNVIKGALLSAGSR